MPYIHDKRVVAVIIVYIHTSLYGYTTVDVKVFSPQNKKLQYSVGRGSGGVGDEGPGLVLTKTLFCRGIFLHVQGRP